MTYGPNLVNTFMYRDTSLCVYQFQPQTQRLKRDSGPPLRVTQHGQIRMRTLDS